MFLRENVPFRNFGKVNNKHILKIQFENCKPKYKKLVKKNLNSRF